MLAACMTIKYTLSHVGKRITQWNDTKRVKLPSKKFVMIPPTILGRAKLNDYYRRASVLSCAKSPNGYLVNLEAVKMSDRVSAKAPRVAVAITAHNMSAVLNRPLQNII